MGIRTWIMMLWPGTDSIRKFSPIIFTRSRIPASHKSKKLIFPECKNFPTSKDLPSSFSSFVFNVGLIGKNILSMVRA